jgi:P-type Mg2+ transporter
MPTVIEEPAKESPPSKPATAKAPTLARVPVPCANAAPYSVELLGKARADADTVLKELGSQLGGLNEAEADARLKQVGTNEIAREKRQSALMRLLSNVKNPLVLLLTALGVLSFLTGDLRATVVIFVIVVLGVVLRFFQEMRADNAAAKLQALVSNTATLVRDGKDAEVSLKLLVPGDIIRLAAGDMVPADARVLSAKDLFLNQAALTGEALPVEKKAAPAPASIENPLELPNICFLGSSVESGSATAVVIHTGNRTYFGSLAASIVGQRQLTSFDLGVNKFTWRMIRFIAVMVPAVFLINGLSKHNWLEAFLFAMAVAVGLTPEMLPMIVTVNLSKGALAMSRKKVIVKRLNAIQNFGAMDVLCTDKTGTLTQGKILLDEAILDHKELRGRARAFEFFFRPIAAREHFALAWHCSPRLWCYDGLAPARDRVPSPAKSSAKSTSIRAAAARSALTNRKLHEASCITPTSRALRVPKSSNTAWHASRLASSKW